MKKLTVLYLGWGEELELGVLADDGDDLLFEYSAQAIARGLELSPYKLPLSDKTYGDFPAHQLRLPGLVSDALPDGWGMMLMDRLFRKQGRDPSRMSPLDRLAFIGYKAMGALAFVPPEGDQLSKDDMELLELAQEIRDLTEEASESTLRKLALLGGSPHGARPKVLVNLDRANNRMSTADESAGTPLLIKFPAHNEHKEVCAIEVMYNRMAAACGLKVPAAEFFDLDEGLSAFGIERFDRFDGRRIPTHTAAGAAHVDFRVPQLDYIGLLRLTRLLTRDAREVLKCYELCVFNVLFNNRDDHSKNFSFLLNRNGRWQLSPVYDLTFNSGPGGEHQMDICGEARRPTLQHLLELAKKTDVPARAASQVIERFVAVSEGCDEFVEDLPIRAKTLDLIGGKIKVNRDCLQAWR